MAGENVTDLSGVEHAGIVKTPIPILKGNAGLLHELRDKTMTETFADDCC